MKFLLAFSALLAIAYSAPVADEAPIKSVQPIDPNVSAPEQEEPIKSDRPISGGVGYIPSAGPQIDINISINGVATPYYEQNLVYVEIRNPRHPPQFAAPGHDFLPIPQPPQIAAPGIEILPDPGLISIL